MRRKNERAKDEANRVVKDIRRQTRRKYSSEDKIRIVLAGLRGEDSIAELCRQEGIAQKNQDSVNIQENMNLESRPTSSWPHKN